MARHHVLTCPSSSAWVILGAVIDGHQDRARIEEGRKRAPIYGAYVGMDVHKDTIAAAAALAGREAPAYCGEIANRPSEIGKLAAKLAQRPRHVSGSSRSDDAVDIG